MTVLLSLKRTWEKKIGVNEGLYKMFVSLKHPKHLAFFTPLFRKFFYSFFVFFVPFVSYKVELVKSLAMYHTFDKNYDRFI